jgi:cytochrome c-type biogenesis protein CcmH/NrfG
MSISERQSGNRIIMILALVLAFFSSGAGLFFCMAESPQQKSKIYLSEAARLAPQDQSAALEASLEATRLNPASPEAWYMLAGLLEEQGRPYAAERATAIATHLKNGTNPPAFYASPAAFRVGLLLNDRPVP